MTEIERNLFAILSPSNPPPSRSGSAAAPRAGWQKFNFPCAIRAIVRDEFLYAEPARLAYGNRTRSRTTQ